ncbi:metallophosphoesterase [Luteolibacter sp. AS25]|uniref:metallophosphoesterase n=1 Tax=Luteolibacter sp. AS25 TaxID=3135776 RepID=UPI00398B80B7
MKLPVRIFSDLHLGHRASHVREVSCLRPLLAGAGTVIFNGDTWEEMAKPWRDRSKAMLGELKKMAEEEQCDLVFVRGNHDPYFSEINYVELAGGKIVVTHGDALLRYSSPWKREILADEAAAEDLWSKLPQAEWDRKSRFEVAESIARKIPSKTYTKRRSLGSRCFDAVFPPKRAFLMLDAWINQGRYAADFCKTYFPEAEVMVIGHFHCAAIRSTAGKTIINTGSFVTPARAYGVVWDGEFLRSGKISLAKDSFGIGDFSGAWKFT